jgi:hypothetical protein
MVIVDLQRLAAESIAAQYDNEHARVYRESAVSDIRMFS